MYHPEQDIQEKQVAKTIPSCSEGEQVLMPALASTIEKFFPRPLTPPQIPKLKPKSCGRVLTSTENLKVLKEKSKRKRNRKERKKKREEKERSRKGKRRSLRRKKWKSN